MLEQAGIEFTPAAEDEPASRLVGRAKGRDGIARAVYVAQHGRTLTVLHVFVKKTQTTPRAAIEIARKRLEGMR